MNIKWFRIWMKIRKYEKIVIARHVGPDPDALSSTIALRDVIKNTYPHKKVYAIGAPASNFKYIGQLDRFEEDMYEDSLLIVLDTPDRRRVDGVNPNRFEYKIKLDHHPFVEKFCNIEAIDSTASSACQLVLELIFKTRLTLTKEAAEKLFIGIVSDTDRFLFSYTTPKTFKLVSKMIKKTNIELTGLYEALYLRPIREVRFQGYVIHNMTVTENGFAYIKIDDEILKEYGVDASTAGNMINNFNYINEVYSWAMFSVDKNNDVIKVSIRSRGPIINTTAAKYGGGGHAMASGARLKNFDEVDLLIADLDKVCTLYNEKLKEIDKY